MNERAASSKSADAYRTISEVAEDLGLPQHVLRFWETRFPQVKPLKRAGGRRFYRPEDVELLRAVQALLYGDGYTIKGVQRMLREQGSKAITALLATPELTAQGGSESLVEAVGETSGSNSDASAGPSLPDRAMVAAEQPAQERGRDTTRSSLESATHLPRRVGADIVGRLQEVVADLAECERLICRVQNPSFSS